MARTRAKVKDESQVNNMYGEDSASGVVSFVSPNPQQASSGSTIRNEDFDMMDTHDIESVPAPQPSIPVSTFAQQARLLIKTIQKLEALGIDSTLPSLPKIVVTGDQSHGKSSVIEAICNISLPRNIGTCTRCPFELVTTAAEGEWAGQVSLVCKYSYTALAKKGAQWVTLSKPDTIPYATVTDKGTLDQILRAAQTATLALHTEEPARAGNHNNVGFSPNYVRVEIRSPELPELSLYDLPGAFSVTQNEKDQHMVSFVDRLIENYVKDDKAIVLLATAANVDVETSKCLNIVRTQQASNRCMGIVTKADLIDGAAIPRVRSMLNNEKWPLQHGWFITKQLSQDELDKGVNYSRAREMEMELFAGEPWCNLAARKRCGIQNLQDALSSKLTTHILLELPEISDRVQTKLNEVEEELCGFPEQSAAPCLEVLTEIDNVAKVIFDNIEAHRTLRSEFRDGYKDVLKKLVQELRAARPSLNVATPGYKAPTISIDIDSDDDLSTPASTPTPTRPTPSSTKSRKANDGRGISSSMGREHSLPVRTPVKKEGFADAVEPRKVILTLSQIRRAFESGNNSGMPDGQSPHVVDHLTLLCLAPSSRIIVKALHGVFVHMRDSLAGYIHEALETRLGTKLYDKVTELTNTLFLELSKKVDEGMANTLACEMYKPFVTDVEYIRDKRDKKRADLFIDRDFRRVTEYYDILDAKSGKDTSRDDRKKKAEDKKWMDNNLGADPQADMVNAITGPFAYYDVATLRMVDALKTRVEHDLLHAYVQQIQLKLREGLRYTDFQYCAELLAQDPAREQKRGELVNERAKLVQALQELDHCRTMANE